ncbi:Basic immunoglobulin-like variable motif-containing protein [Lamellibrachia satsuma]|nr:Basic immunoglobulin-like variable motif-containing protein [Lamellibrachia satsuma]
MLLRKSSSANNKEAGDITANLVNMTTVLKLEHCELPETNTNYSGLLSTVSVTGLETLNSVDEASNQSKGWPSVTTACCLEQQLHSTEGESTEVDKLVDFHCLESDADILGELQDDHWLDPFSVPTNPKDAHVTSLTHAMTAWDVTDPVVKTPSGELVPNQGEIGEYVGDGEFKKKDGADDIHTMEEFGSCENQGNQFEQKLLGSQVDFPLVTSSMKPQSEEVARISQVMGTKIAWEVDITELIGKKGRGKRPRKNVTADCGRLDHKTADLRKGRPLGQECQVSSRAVIERKMLDLRRWYCISRPQYKTSCGISSVVSCWNFLFSSLGVGIHQPITQEEALTLLGFQQPYGDIKFGPFTGNNTLLMWFRAINRYYGVRGRGFYLYKPHGKNRTAGMTSQDALAQLKKGLAGTDVAYVYHCLNHYFCPIGFEDTPRNAESAYQEDTDSEEIDTWILIGDTSRKHPSMHCKRWEDISADLNNQNPDFLDVRRLWCGPQQRQSKKKGGNLHCIMGFQRCGPPRYKTRKHKKAVSTSTCAPAERDGIPDTDPATQPLSRPRPVREVKSFSGINHGATFKDDARNIARSRGKHSRSCDAF